MDHQVVHDEGTDGTSLSLGEHEDLTGDVTTVSDAYIAGGTVHTSEEAQGLVQLHDLSLRLAGRYRASLDPHRTTSISLAMSLHIAFWEQRVGR